MAHHDRRFSCLDGDRFVRKPVSELPRPVQDCVVDAVLADREVRVAYVLGTKGSAPSDDMEEMTAPLVDAASGSNRTALQELTRPGQAASRGMSSHSVSRTGAIAGSGERQAET